MSKKENRKLPLYGNLLRRKDMIANSVLLRCRLCAALNRVPADRLADHPKCGKCKSLLEFPKAPIEVTTSNFDIEVLGSPGIVIVFFWAPWCAHCRAMIPILQELARERVGLIKVVMVNTEKESLLARRFDVLSVPKLALYQGGGKINELNGAVKKSDMESWIDYYTKWR
jgi:thioredoxin 2